MDKKGNSIVLLKNLLGNRKSVKTPDIMELQNIAATVHQTEDIVVIYPDSPSTEVKIPGNFLGITYENRLRI